MTERAQACPKHMVHGPCGGVAADGGCELPGLRCSFVDGPVVPWQPLLPRDPGGADPVIAPDPQGGAEGRRQGDQLRALLRAGRVVVADLPTVALSARSVAETADALRGRVHAVLAGDSPRNRVQFPPASRAALVRAAGLRPWSGLTCRDRNRVALEGELAALAEVGTAAVHCVTGDHPATGSRPDAAAVFDLDSTQLAELAVAAGLLTSVAKSPATPPAAQRPARLVEKLATGAEVCFVNHCGGVDPVRAFVDAVHARGAEPWFLPCVPVVVDRASAELLASFPGFVLPPGHLDAVVGARDPREAGIRAAVELSDQLLALDGVAGVNLSGGGAPGHEVAFAEALAEIGRRLDVRDAQPCR